MTREEQAFEASKIFEESLTEKDLATLSKDDMCFAFQLGVKWADNHSKSPWISVNEKLPPVEKDDLSIKVLVVSTKGGIHISRYDYDMKGWISPVLDIEFTHWMQLPKLPKE